MTGIGEKRPSVSVTAAKPGFNNREASLPGKTKVIFFYAHDLDRADRSQE
ncbi:hypothetical protein [Methyloceanibacter methanicus]|nr:hypothetical protein [Methyloceanibacter methanicus]